jgi:hypothetical protein
VTSGAVPTSKRQGIARLVIGAVAAVWTAVTFYFVGAVSVALVYMAAFTLAWFAVRVLMQSKYWRMSVGWGWIALAIGLATALSNIVSSTTSDEFSTRAMGVAASLTAGLTLSVWFSAHRWDKIE